MKIISWNLNGIRAANKKGFFEWFKQTNADIYCFQELKAQENQIPEELLNFKKYNHYFSVAEKKGYSGVAVFSKEKPLKVSDELGFARFDSEGRMLKLEFKDFILINFYIPHGGRAKENLYYKLDVYKKIFTHLKKIENKNIILAGDFNIAHEYTDLARPRENENNIMFTEEERKQIDELISLGFFDSYRKLNPTKIQFTWWPYFAAARERNLGWRIDYIFVSKNMFPRVQRAFILDQVLGSDHCPIGIQI
jgi:exodeoxyribonuclease-3